MPAYVKKYGDWHVSGRLLSWLKKGELTKAGQNWLEKCAKKYVEIVKGHIKNQDLPWVALSRRTIEAKGHAKILIATGEYLEKIGYRFVKSKVGGKVFAGASRYKTHRASGLNLAVLARKHEYGVPEENIPARPLYAPSWEEVKPYARRRLMNIYDTIREVVK